MKLKSKLLYLLYPFVVVVLLLLVLIALLGIVLSRNMNRISELLEEWEEGWGIIE